MDFNLNYYGLNTGCQSVKVSNSFSTSLFPGKVEFVLVFFYKEKPFYFRISRSFLGFVNVFSVFSFASFKFILIFAFEIIPYEIAITSFS